MGDDETIWLKFLIVRQGLIVRDTNIIKSIGFNDLWDEVGERKEGGLGGLLNLCIKWLNGSFKMGI